MTKWPEITRVALQHPEALQAAQEKLGLLYRRAATDAEFRRRLVAEPTATYTEFTGDALPEGFRIAFIESKGVPTVVLPDPVDDLSEVSAEELEAVAGGTNPTVFFITAAMFSLAAAAINQYEKAHPADSCDCC